MLTPFLGVLILFTVSCQTTPKIKDENIRFVSGKALIHDKIKDKQDWVNFTASVSHPHHLRIDAYLGLLSIPLGTLVINNDDAVFVNIIEKKIYKTNQGSVVLEKLLKTPVSSYDVIAVFAEKFPLNNNWQCGGDTSSQRCTQKNLQIDWSRTPADDKNLIIEGPKSKINFVYTQRSSGKTDFNLKLPTNYEVIAL